MTSRPIWSPSPAGIPAPINLRLAFRLAAVRRRTTALYPSEMVALTPRQVLVTLRLPWFPSCRAQRPGVFHFAKVDSPRKRSSVLRSNCLWTGVTRGYGLEKPVWTDADLDRMGWHDCPVRAIRTINNFRISWDIFWALTRSWSGSSSASEPFKFHMPPTFVLGAAGLVRIDVHPGQTQSSLGETRREAEGPPQRGRPDSWRWSPGLTEGSIGFRSTGYRQYIRKMPIPTRHQRLTLEERGGIMFERAIQAQ